jgi:Glycosyl transferase family 2
VPTWSILIATLARRQEKLLRLLAVLLPQAEASGRVEVVALHNKGEHSIGRFRQALLEDARGMYVSFVDDDDMVEPDFVAAVLEAAAGSPDYIAFRHAYYENGVRDRHVTVTGIQYQGWFDTPDFYFRDVTHINPVRTELALKAGFSDMGSGEDAAYDARLRPLLRTQAEIDRVLYHYFHSWPDSAQMPRSRWQREFAGARLQVVSPAFRWHAWSTR